MRPRSILQSLGVRARVLILAILPVASVVGLLGYHLASSRIEDAERNLAERGSLIARNLALASEFALFSSNMPLVSDTLQRVADQPEVRWAGIWDQQRRILVSRGDAKDDIQTKQIVEAFERGAALPPGNYQAPIRVELMIMTDFNEEYASLEDEKSTGPAELLGFAVIEVATHKIAAKRANIVRDSILITLAGLAGSILLALLIGNSITEPLVRLLKAVRELRSGKLGTRVRARAGGEIGILEEGINEMADTLEKGQQNLELRVEEATAALRHTVAELEVRNEELEQARQIALRAGQERTEFLARMSHEIRTPLNAVVGFAKLLDTGASAQTNVEHLRTIQSAAEQLLHIINDILQFIRLDAGADQLESLPFNIGEILEDVVAMLSPMANEKGLELVLLLHSDLPESMLGDPSRLSQVVVNLVNNAIKFTSEGQVIVEVSRQTAESVEEYIEIAVSDTGIGLDPEEQARIFVAFSQSDSSITRRFGGTGLGLSIAKRLAELMDGDITVQSNKNGGSCFSLRLPCHGCSAPAAIESGEPLARQRVMVYDVNPFVRRSLRNTLMAWDMGVFNTGRWEQVLQMLSDGSAGGEFAAVILGLSHTQQKADDIERFLDELRVHHQGFVLVLTGSENWSPRETVRSSGPIAWATKPIRRLTLRRLLTEPLGGCSTTVGAPPLTVGSRKLLGMQILVAEDNPLNRELLRHILEQQGATIDEAITGKAAINAAKHGGYNVILMDLHMPEVNGADAARQIRANLGTDAPPIVALTADVFGRTDLQGAEADFDDWLLKPVDPNQLVDKLVSLGAGKASLPPDKGEVTDPSPMLPDALREKYWQEIKRLAGSLREAVTRNDHAGAAQAIHDLKGIVGICGDPKLIDIATRLQAKDINSDRGSVLTVLDQLQNCLMNSHQGATDAHD